MNKTAPWEMEDGLTDPLDDGSMALSPFAFDPLCELQGESWPRDASEAAGYEYEISHWSEDVEEQAL